VKPGPILKRPLRRCENRWMRRMFGPERERGNSGTSSSSHCVWRGPDLCSCLVNQLRHINMPTERFKKSPYIREPNDSLSLSRTLDDGRAVP
jgi:hypothetical protein